jgi:hypothetical protein
MIRIEQLDRTQNLTTQGGMSLANKTDIYDSLYR